MENDDIINPVQEFRQEPCLERVMNRLSQLIFIATLLGHLLNDLTTSIACHHDHRIGEIDGASLPIGQATIVQNLQ